MIISTSEISVILQGAISGKPDDPFEKQGTQSCIDNLRVFLPDAEIIVSTWEGSEVSHLTGYDKLIFSNDPGAITYNDFELKNVYNNNNRQIVSTSSGLNTATRKFAIKYRADFRLRNLDFIQYWGIFKERRKYRFFEERIVTCNLASRDYTKSPLLFAISDLFQFGLTEDLQALWTIPLQPEPQTTRSFDYSKQFWNDPFRFNQYKMQYSSEQYIWYAFAKKNNLDLTLKYFCELPIFKIVPSIVSIIDNYTIVDYDQLGIIPPQRLIHSEKDMITTERWIYLYNNLILKPNRKIIAKELYKTLKVGINQYRRNRKS